ncbi:OmpA family protein [Paracrocinitomix mangrovi]|uniref:OmpA family protein n=1 Tax=Paracrocinitomix mangrovi TaxID=2862509 RepID=UPI001C8DBA6D|nr:OmpA family protein [Paracrocinitomix mangrovi]UKN01066.1 OmpA family protein [Paracrocinitomix mangrovi]
MKNILLLFGLFTFGNLFGQNITGNWQGIMTHPKDTGTFFTDNFAFWLNIEQEGDTIIGQSRTEMGNSKNFCVMNFKGAFQNGHMTIIETSWEESYMQDNVYIHWCLKRVSLIYTFEDSTETLRGLWTSTEEGCGPGEIYLHRSIKEFNDRTSSSHDYVTFAEFKRKLRMGESVKGLKVVLSEVVFDFNEAKLLPKSRAILKELKEIMDKYPGLKLDIIGHTGNLGSDRFNLTLSLQRAKTVKDFLVKMGISESRFQYHGFGESRPIATNTTDEGRRKNRRIEFEVFSE